ncbi:portal protein [Corynebacterium phage EmiRose]|uniref:Portal protein n=1 Tax=Corynebacterium phage EmiRose TaxID=2565372 RepID=A0A649VNX4_9CAUD|nr:portal protein [Corynebacterium phage EmiRose]QGJ94136.1 portal protein [Corynebacterium phage EmiRose]
MLTPVEVRAIVDELKPDLDKQRQETIAVDSWIRPDLVTGFTVPPRASKEHRNLAKLSRTPWLGLVVTNVTQAMYVDSVVTEEGPNQDLWRIWANNDMGRVQIANHRAMVSYGQSFGVVTPAELDGVDTARIRCLSPARMACKWEDAATDVYPLAAIEAVNSKAGCTTFRVYAPGYIYTVDTEQPGAWFAEPVQHSLEVCPVVRFSNQLSLDGHVTGEVTPFIPTAARINKTAYDRLLAQHFNSWKVRTIAGIDMPSDEENPENDPALIEQAKIKLSQEDLLVSEDVDTKFGTLDGTSLDTFVTAWRSDIEALAAVSQTPAHALTGMLVNLSPEALAAARSPLTQKVWERQVSAGASYARLLRLAASLAGMGEIAADPLVRVTWQDLEIRSMSQAVDALGKAAQMLGIPKQALWNRIPGVERSDVEEWERLADEEAENDPLKAVLRGHSSQSADSAGDTGGEV